MLAVVDHGLPSGPASLGEPNTRQLDGKLRELRLRLERDALSTKLHVHTV
jgi:hypothetical protein